MTSAEDAAAANEAKVTGDESSESAPESSTLEAQCLDLKTKGNAALMAGQILDAILHYSSAIELCDEHTNSDGDNNDNNIIPKNALAVILSNRAQAYIKVENYGLAIVDATNAIEADATYPKAYYRRGTCEFALNKFKDARKDFKMVCKLRPKDRDARAKYAACDKMVKEAAFAKAIVSAETAPLSETFEPQNISITKAYGGPHPMGDEPLTDMEKEDDLFKPGNLPIDFVMAAIQCFKDQNLIHKRYVARLLINCKNYFESLPSLLDIPIPSTAAEGKEDPYVTVCGDTHGQFYDVLNIFSLNGYPSKNNPFLFNGDFVDRGSFSIEVILTFLLFKMACPESIYLTRGNHETKNMNRIYGFEGEVKHKYDEQIFNLFLEVFCHLPLAATIEEKIFITHGGIPVDPVTLDDIRKIKRGCEPPESGLMSDLLWSDPQPFDGKSPSKRGVGFAFGPDITEAFLNKNSLKLLVRSHEVKDEGYLVEHGGKTITVFSAPNYCDSMGNKGAFIRFGKDLEPQFTKFEHVPHPPIRPMAYAAGMGGLFS